MYEQGPDKMYTGNINSFKFCICFLQSKVFLVVLLKATFIAGILYIGDDAFMVIKIQ